MIPITKWAGLVTNASQYAIPPGAAVEQVNLQCLVPGQLTCRPGMAAVVFPNPSTTTQAIVRAFRYQHGSSEHIVYQDAAGNIYSSAVAAGGVATVSPPSAPTITSAYPGNTTIAVAVTAPAATGGGPITGYSFEVSQDTGVTWASGGSSSSTDHIIKNLVNGTSYLVRAAATNSAGRGDYSVAFGPVAPRAASVGPSQPPSYVSATASGASAVVVSWYTPTSDGGAPITGYIIQQSSDRGFTWTQAVTVGVANQASVSGLAGGADYVFRVAAITSFGTGQFSAASNFVSIAGAGSTPSQPLNLSGVATTTSVTLSWAAPGSAGSSAITGYTIRYGTSATGPWTTLSASGLTGAVTGLTANTSYVFGVFASNASGAGQIATTTVATLATVANTVPSAPTSLALTPTATGFSATWSASATDGGSAITAYRLTTASTASGQETQVYQNTSLSYTASGITAGSTVWVSVYAINAVGASARTQASVRVGLAPTAPLNFAAAPTSANVALSWSAPSNLYGQQVTAYVLNYGSGYGETVAGNTLSKTLVPAAGQPWVTGATYTYTVAAVTAAGTGATASVSFTVPQAPGVKPGTPTNYTLTGTNGGFIATWDAPSSLGSSPLLGYKTYMYVNNAWVLINTSTAQTYEHTGITAGVATPVRTTAYSAVGESDIPAQGTVTPFTLPSAPYNLTASISYSGSSTPSVTLAWTRPTSFGGLALSQYVIHRDGSQVAVSTQSFVQIAQPVGTARYVVYAETAAGRSAASPELSVTVVNTSAPEVPVLGYISGARGEAQFTALSTSDRSGAGVTYEAQYSLDYGVTWLSSGMQTLSAIEGGGAKFALKVPYAGATSRAVAFRASATRVFGGQAFTSAWSSALSINITFSIPVFSPTITAVDLESSTMRVSWTAPTSDGGAPLTGYTVRYRNASNVATNYAVSATTLSAIVNRTSSQGDYIDVLATNARGSTTATLALSPQFSMPRNLVINASTAGIVQLLWTAPQFTSGRTVTSYEISRSTDNANWTVLSTVTATQNNMSTALSSQPSGTAFYRVQAVSGSAKSSPAVANKPALPTAVLGLTYTGDGNGATVSWNAPTYDGDSQLQNYVVEYGVQLDGQVSGWRTVTPLPLAPGASPPTSASVPYILGSGQYLARVYAKNAVGTGPFAQITLDYR